MNAPRVVARRVVADAKRPFGRHVLGLDRRRVVAAGAEQHLRATDGQRAWHDGELRGPAMYDRGARQADHVTEPHRERRCAMFAALRGTELALE